MDINECDGSHGPSGLCGQGALCSNVPGSHHCYCPPGFTGDPFRYCEDIDECSRRYGLYGQCGNNAVCENTMGSFQCSCPAGYTGNPRDECLDVDECSETFGPNGKCGYSAICTNTPGMMRVTSPRAAHFHGQSHHHLIKSQVPSRVGVHRAASAIRSCSAWPNTSARATTAAPATPCARTASVCVQHRITAKNASVSTMTSARHWRAVPRLWFARLVSKGCVCVCVCATPAQIPASNSSAENTQSANWIQMACRFAFVLPATSATRTACPVAQASSKTSSSTSASLRGALASRHTLGY